MPSGTFVEVIAVNITITLQSIGPKRAISFKEVCQLLIRIKDKLWWSFCLINQNQHWIVCRGAPTIHSCQVWLKLFKQFLIHCKQFEQLTIDDGQQMIRMVFRGAIGPGPPYLPKLKIYIYGFNRKKLVRHTLQNPPKSVQPFFQNFQIRLW